MRKLRIDIKLANQAMHDKALLDTLALCLMIKSRYKSSVVHDWSYMKLRRAFHLGQERIRNIIRYGLDNGYFRIEGRHLIANKIHYDGCYSAVIKGSQFDNAVKENNNHRLTITAVRDFIRRAVLMNHVKVLNDIQDTHRRATQSHDACAIRRAQLRERRMLRKCFDTRYVGLSNVRIQALLGCKHNKASKIVCSAVSDGVLLRKVREYNLPCDPLACTTDMVSFFKERNETILVWPSMRMARIKLSNMYVYNDNSISARKNGAFA